MNKFVDVKFQFTVTESGEFQAPTDEQMAQAISTPGSYSVVPSHQVQGLPKKEAAKKLFHLGELPTLSMADCEQLSVRGLRTSDQVLAAGVLGLQKSGLEADLIDRLCSSMSRLGLRVLQRNGSLPASPREKVVKAILDEYRSCLRFWGIRKSLEDRVKLDVSSSFTLMDGKAQIVCGRCGKQTLEILKESLPEESCQYCGNEINVDWHSSQVKKRADLEV